MQFSVNSPILYVIVGAIIALVLAQSVYFLVKAVRRAKELGILKSTVKKSCVLKMKTLSGGGFRVQSRTDRTSWRQVQRSGGTVEQVISADVGGFDGMSFGAVSFAGDGGITVPIMEKEKKWVEKQYFVYSDEYMKPFSVFYIAYRYTVVGRYKQ